MTYATCLIQVPSHDRHHTATHPTMRPHACTCAGGARGIGLNSARLLAYLGAAVYLADVDVPRLRAAVGSIEEAVPG